MSKLRASTDRPLVSPDRPLSNIMADSSRNFVTPPAGTKKDYFSTLAPDPSDEIKQFDDEETTGAKRVTDLAVPELKAETSRPSKRMVRAS